MTPLEKLVRALRDRVAKSDGWGAADLLLPAADALEALIAERDALRAGLDRLLTIARSDADFQGAHPARDAAIYTASKALNQYRKGDL